MVENLEDNKVLVSSKLIMSGPITTWGAANDKLDIIV